MSNTGSPNVHDFAGSLNKLPRKIIKTHARKTNFGLVPDTSLGIINLRTPSSWRNAMVHVNRLDKVPDSTKSRAFGDSEKRKVQQVKNADSRRKKCGCNK
jgi:hypothetical protein